MSNIKSKASYILTLIYLYLFASNTYAQGSGALGAGGCGDREVYTAIGCIPVGTPTNFADFLLTWSFGIGGGIALLLIAYGSFQILTSAGDTKKVQAGREVLTAAIAGLVFLIFSIFILRVLNVDILGFE